jgi:drug/metabolite transporter superfamily protein YnfA
VLRSEAVPSAVRRVLAVEGRRDGRLVILLALGSYFAALLISSAASDDFDLWRYFGVTRISGPFEDMRVITSGWECTRRGYDVLVENPCDPFRREMNYPRIWMSLAHLGLGQGSTVILSLATWVIFFVAVFFLIGRVTKGEALVYAAILLSPSVMLGVGAANNDLLIFAIIVAALVTLRAGRPLVRAGSYCLFLLAALLKIYPAFAFTVLLRQGRRRAAVGLAATLIPTVVYLLLTRDELELISKATPRPTLIAYGAGVFVEGVSERLAGAVPGASVFTHAPGRTVAYALLLAIALALALWMAGRLRPRVRPASVSERELDAFWAGASIYLGTFAVVGHNWDYRLLFLILTVPQLLSWIRGSGPMGAASTWALGGVVATMWLSRLTFVFPLDELLNLSLCIFFAAALMWTAPEWLIGSPRQRLGRRFQRRTGESLVGR